MKPKLVALAIAIFFVWQPAASQWVQTGGPEGGVVQCFAVDGTTVVVGTEGGVFLSESGGKSWSRAGMAGIEISCLALRGNILFAGTYNRGVFLSTDHGDYWTSRNVGLTDTNVHALLISGMDLFAGTYGTVRGVFRSTDNGASWNVASTGLPGSGVHVISSVGPNLLVDQYGRLSLERSGNPLECI